MKPILNIENLTKIYGNVPSQTKALNGITFQVMPGEFLGIMGSSGSGKSTLPVSYTHLIRLHTMNPVGRENMLRMIRRYW